MKHGQAKNGDRSPEYNCWLNMKQRCQNPSHPRYKDWGGRGIKVCNRWQDFRNFFTDMGKKPGPEYTIDRIDNDGNYEPGNCHWVTLQQQYDNRRFQHWQKWFWALSPRNELIKTNSITNLAYMFNLNRRAIFECLKGKMNHHHGWTFAYI